MSDKPFVGIAGDIQVSAQIIEDANLFRFLMEQGKRSDGTFMITIRCHTAEEFRAALLMGLKHDREQANKERT